MDELFRKRMKDLAMQAYNKGIYTYSSFLSEAEISDIYGMEREIDFIGFTLFGGYQESTRKLVRFGSLEQLGYDEDFPIDCILIEPVNVKFGEELSHRDYLGALMNLGIERDTIGDILVKEKKAYVLCLGKISDYILENLGKIRHTIVRVNKTEQIPQDIQPNYSEEVLLVSSERADTIVAHFTKLSRSAAVELFREKAVYVNGRVYENNSGVLKNGDILSVRGYGKMIYDGIEASTRKGKLKVNIRRYQ